MRNTNSEITVPLDDTTTAASPLGIAEIRAVMQACRSDALTAAETALMAERDALAGLRGEERAIARALHKAATSRTPAEHKAADRAAELPEIAKKIEAAETLVGRRRRILDEERGRLVEGLRRELRNPFVAALRRLAAGLAEIEAAERVFVEIDAFAAKNGVETPLRLPRRIGAEDVARDIAGRLGVEK
jgi:hypothetical protein